MEIDIERGVDGGRERERESKWRDGMRVGLRERERESGVTERMSD